MKYTKDTINFARDIIFHYSKYDTLSKSYVLSLHNIHEFDLHKLASLIMSENQSFASEATGPDNSSFPRMLEALNQVLFNSNDKDKKIEFISTWQEGITNYFHESMEELLSKLLIEYNEDHDCKEENYRWAV